MNKYGIPCQICSHPKIDEINERILNEVVNYKFTTFKKLALEYGVNRLSLTRHNQNHIPNELKNKKCADCNTDINHKSAHSKRCDSCQDKYNRRNSIKNSKEYRKKNQIQINERSRNNFAKKQRKNDRRRKKYAEDINFRLKIIAEVNSRRALGKISPELIKNLLIKQDNKCGNVYCKKDLDKFTVEHFIPVSKDGTNDPKNLSIWCPTCNFSKWNLQLNEFYAREESWGEKKKNQLTE